MAIEIITHSATLDGAFPPFEFSGPVSSFVYGLSGFNIGYSGRDHHLETFSVGFEVNQVTSNSIALSPNVQFHDASGNHAYRGSSICATVVAWLGEDGPVMLQNTLAQPSLSTYKIPARKHAYSAGSILSGFDLSYGDQVDHHVETMAVATQASQLGGTVNVNVRANMYDASGSQSLNPTVSSGVIAAFAPTTGFEMQMVRGTLSQNTPLKVQFHRKIDQAALLLTDFNLSYGNIDHHVLSVVSGYLPTPGFPQIYGESASFHLTDCQMKDSSGNHATQRVYNFLAIARYA